VSVLHFSAAYAKLTSTIENREAIFNTADLATGDPSECNAQILEGYAALSDALGRLLHGQESTPENATFATFAAWAAVTLRREAVLDEPRMNLMHPTRSIYRSMAKVLLQGDDAIARNIVRGQAEVYEEIGSAIYALMEQTKARLDDVERLTADLEKGPAKKAPDEAPTRAQPDEAVDAKSKALLDCWIDIWKSLEFRLIETYQEVSARRATGALDASSVVTLQAAIRPYFLVLQQNLARTGLTPEDHKKRAELILLGNLRLVAYEQKRLQPVFERNLSYLPNLFKDAVGKSLGRHVFLTSSLRRPYRAFRKFGGIANEAFQIAASRRVFSMIVGSEDLSFGRHLPVPPPANPLLRGDQPVSDRSRYHEGAFFPADLTTLVDSSVWAQWQLFDRSSGSGGRTAVNDWLRYGERMNFIVNAFRSRQQLSGLYDLPVEATTKQAAPAAPKVQLGPVMQDSEATERKLAQILEPRA
jgi:hypothetical protein